MSVISKITSKCQTTLPPEVREGLGVGPGDRVEYTRLPDGTFSVRKARHGLEALRGIIKVNRSYTNDEIVAMVREIRGEVGDLRDRN